MFVCTTRVAGGGREDRGRISRPNYAAKMAIRQHGPTSASHLASYGGPLPLNITTNGGVSVITPGSR